MKHLPKCALISLIIILQAGLALAVGTTAGTTITNQASANYSVSGSSFTENSNPTTTQVAEILNITTTWQDAANITVHPSDTAQVLTFQITNTGNGSDFYTLTGLSTLAGDNFDPGLTNIYLDTNNNGVYDSDIDAVYTAGSNDPTLAADASVIIFLLNNIPGAVSDADLGNSQLTAASNTGTGSAGTTIAGEGESGTDAVVGTSEGQSAQTGTYQVSTVVVSLIKASTIADPFGTNEPVPGAIITYTITITVTGSGTAQALIITDAIPANTIYQAGTLSLGGGGLSDGADGDVGDVGGTTAGTVTVNLGDLAGGTPAQNISFQVAIN